MEITAALVKDLREKTGAGMMNCKKALIENNGDFEKATESLNLKGLATADKKASRSANEGIIDSYIHTGSKLGILIEVNCETDFVARQSQFKEFVKNLAMQIAASPTVEYVSIDNIPADVKESLAKIETEKEDLAGKPEEIKQNIIKGRVAKSLNTKVLLAQPYMRDNTITINDLLTKQISTLGENIKIARFSKFNLGEEV